MCTYCCNCGYDNGFEDDCCSDISNKVKGRFGLAFVAETPCCCPEPIGWQVEFCDTPSKVEQRCREMVQWVNCPPLPRCEPCPPYELCSPCLPPKCNPCCPKTNPYPPRCPSRCRPACQCCPPCPSRPLSPRRTSCRCSVPTKPKGRCCCQLSKVQYRCNSESSDAFYDDDEEDDDDYCPCALRNRDNRDRSETPSSDYDRPEKPSPSSSYTKSTETDRQKTVGREIDARGNIYRDEIPVRDTKPAVAKQPPRNKTPGVFKSPINPNDRQRSATAASARPGMNKNSNNKHTVYDQHDQSQVLEYDSGGDTAVYNHRINNTSSNETQKERVLAFTTYSSFSDASKQLNPRAPNNISSNQNENEIRKREPNTSFNDDTLSDRTTTSIRHSAPPKLPEVSDHSETDASKSYNRNNKQTENHPDSQGSTGEITESSQSQKTNSLQDTTKQNEVPQNNLKTFIKNSTEIRKEDSTTSNNKTETVRKLKNSNSLEINVEATSAKEMEDEIHRELERRIDKALRKHSSSSHSNLSPCIECNIVRKRRWLALEMIKKLRQMVAKLFRSKENSDFDSDSFSGTSLNDTPQE